MTFCLDKVVTILSGHLVDSDATYLDVLIELLLRYFFRLFGTPEADRYSADLSSQN